MGDVLVQGAPTGPLHGLTAVVKDSYDTAGHRTSNGSPAWLDSHPPAERNAAAVQVGGRLPWGMARYGHAASIGGLDAAPALMPHRLP